MSSASLEWYRWHSSDIPPVVVKTTIKNYKNVKTIIIIIIIIIIIAVRLCMTIQDQ